jgi:hypothetical protein
MLTLSSPGAHLSLEIRGYQFPDTAADGWDAEWLHVSGLVEVPRGRWKFSDPCLATFELAQLGEWLRDVPVGGPERELEFMEPCLRFEHVERSEGDVLVVRLAQEASPPWATEAQRYRDGIDLEFPFSALDFEKLAAEVRAMCRRFPQRSRSNAV